MRTGRVLIFNDLRQLDSLKDHLEEILKQILLLLATTE